MTLRTPIVTLLCLAPAGAALAQEALYSNGSADPNIPAIATGALSASGQAAPSGAAWSELQADDLGANCIGGFSAHGLLDGSMPHRIADDFTVGPGWSLASIDVFVYQTGFDGPTPPFVSGNARIWWGPPDAPGSFLMGGSTTENRLVQVTPTDVYRVFNSSAAPAPQAPSTARRIWRASLRLDGIVLNPGIYWIDWQILSADPNQEVFAVPATIAGERATPAANALRLDWRTGAAWQPAIDGAKPTFAPDVAQDIAFIIMGDGTPLPPCPVDWDRNGFVNSVDVAAFINSWFEDQALGTLVADFNADGLTNSTDVGAFINEWFAAQEGCG